MRNPALELEGETFHNLAVMERVENNKWGSSQWLCKCSCGNEKIIAGSEIKKGTTKSCGCVRALTTLIWAKMDEDDLSGRNINGIMVLEREYNHNFKANNPFYRCLCKCGKQRTISRKDITYGSKTCYCHRKSVK